MSKKRPKAKAGHLRHEAAGAVRPGCAAPRTGGSSPWKQAVKLVWLAVPVGLGVLLLLAVMRRLNAPTARPDGARKESSYVARPKGTLTFTRDVARIVFNKCAGCHHPGASAPFSLLTYTEVRKHARQIADVTQRRYMPPWLPEPGSAEFAGERRLSSEELGVLQQWIAEGTLEGDPAQLPPPPPERDAWQLGEPDLIVELPPYTLSGDGKDVYRNLVAPIPTSATRFIRGVEFLPGNAKVVHHAFINVDETRQSRRLAQKENPPGFDGMDLPESAIMPGGQLLGWQPGKTASMVDEGLAWVLKPNSDLVLQLHLHPTGKPEVVQPRVGFYFTDQAPVAVPFRIRLVRFDFEIPPGATNHLVEQTYRIPVDLELRRVLPHCHYLGKDLQAYALLPNGEKRWLLWIKDWDFNWQGDYQYAHPIRLPKGTLLVMRYFYDNSTNNPRNPNSPPKLVHHGLQTTDEMAALALQAVLPSPADRALLADDYAKHYLRVSMDSYEYRLRLNPGDSEAHLKLGRALFSQGAVEQALAHLLAAVNLNPDDDRAHYELGFIYLHQQRLTDAYRELQTVTRLNPDDWQAFGSLGYICLTAGKNEEARAYLETALRLNPEDTVARGNLARLQSPP